MNGARKVDHVSPVVFLSYTHEDHDLAEGIATQMTALGIDTWWDQWEIRAGDSIVQKIGDGLGDCTHFIALLTPRSIDKPWVKAEMDAAFVRKLKDSVKFIPLRCDLPAERLPPLLSGLHSPQITDASSTETVAQLVNDIFGVTTKPARGGAPTMLDHSAAPYSPAAMAVAEYFCRETKHAATFDPMVGNRDLAQATGLSLDDTVDAQHELSYFVDYTKESAEARHVWPKPAFWPEFDPYFEHNPDPAGDALVIAARMLNDPKFPKRLASIAAHLDWQPRRLNPAVAYLMDREVVRHLSFFGMGQWVTGVIERTDATRRFVKSQT